MGLMLFQANEEIRSQVVRSETLRLVRLREREPFAYLDWLINELEEYHVGGWKRVPKHFLPSLLAVGEIPASGLQVPDRWPGLIRDAIDKCFGLQEQLLRLRDPDRVRGRSEWEPSETVEQLIVEDSYATA